MAVMDAVLSAPERSFTQRMDALQRANDVRSFRADLKRRLKRGDAAPMDMLEPRDELATMKVFGALLAIPKVGRVKANKTLLRLRISPSKTLGGLSDRQRGELAAYLRGVR